MERSRQISITEARELCKQEGVVILWRPEVKLPEAKQYAVVLK